MKLQMIYWRASLVPAAAVIPAPIAYIIIAVVKLLVVVCMHRTVGPPVRCVSAMLCICVETIRVRVCSTCVFHV